RRVRAGTEAECRDAAAYGGDTGHRGGERCQIARHVRRERAVHAIAELLRRSNLGAELWAALRLELLRLHLHGGELLRDRRKLGVDRVQRVSAGSGGGTRDALPEFRVANLADVYEIVARTVGDGDAIE